MNYRYLISRGIVLLVFIGLLCACRFSPSPYQADYYDPSRGDGAARNYRFHFQESRQPPRTYTPRRAADRVVAPRVIAPRTAMPHRPSVRNQR